LIQEIHLIFFLNRNLCGLYEFLPLRDLSQINQAMEPLINVARILRGSFILRDENCSIFIYQYTSITHIVFREY
jgi:hypothetical protein